jgi:hypothetical protein
LWMYLWNNCFGGDEIVGLVRSVCCSLLLTLLCISSAVAASRFTDNGDTVTDTKTGLMWTKSANLPGTDFDYEDTLSYVAGMNASNALGHSDWRVPTIDEYYSLVDFSRSFPALPAGHPFVDLHPYVYYWSANPLPDSSKSPQNWEIEFDYGNLSTNHLWNNDLVWPVRGVMTGLSSHLSIAPAARDFGTLPINTASAPQVFNLGNSGSALLVVSDITSNGADQASFTVKNTCGIILPGTSCNISVIFTPASSGAKSSILRITSNDPDAPRKEALLSGAGADTAPPQLSAGPNRTANAVFTQTGSAADGHAMTYQWTKQAGPGNVSFGSANALTTTVSATADGSYTLRLTATDPTGNSTYSEMALVWDTVAPALSISTLADGAVTNHAVLNIAGSASDASGIAELTVANSAVTINPDGSFSQPVALQPGTTSITITAVDNAGNRSSDIRRITLDRQLPPLSIEAPADNSSSNASFVTVTGTVVPPIAGVTVAVNTGTAQQASINGTSFSAGANLSLGLNTIEVTVTDLSEKKNTLKRTVFFNGQRPTLAITTPVEDFETTLAAQTIYGTIANALPPATVTVSDGSITYTPAVTGASFSQALNLAATKTYQIAVTVTEGNGNKATVWRNILYSKSDPASLPSSVTGLFYSQDLTPGGGGTPPYTWSLVSGTLPAGLSLNAATGAITGTPTKSGVYSSTVQILDANRVTETRQLAITITDLACGNAPVRIAGATPVSYADFPGAYAQALDNSVIQLQALDFTSDFLFNRNIRVGVQGGYACNYSGSATAAGILGVLRVTSGTANIDKLRFR